MRDILTAIATLIVLALIAVMVGPHFVDWAQRRDQVAAAISERLGIETRIGGALSLTILPTPALDVAAIEFGSVDNPLLRADRLTLALSPMALLSGRVQVSAARADKVRVSRDSLARISSDGQWPTRAELIGIEQLDLREVSIVDRVGMSTPQPEAAYDVSLSAPSLAGPFRIDMIDASAGREFRAQIGKIEAGRARMKGTIEDKHLGARLVLDGTIALPGQPGRPVFDGSMVANGNPLIGGPNGAQLPFQSAARIVVHEDRLMADPMNITLGSGEAAIQLEGRAIVENGNGKRGLDAKFTTKRIDLAVLLGGDAPGQKRLDPRVLQAMSVLRDSIVPGTMGQIELTAGAVQFAGPQAQNLAASITLEEGRLQLSHLEFQLPGATRVRFRREQAPPMSWIGGQFRLESQDFTTFVASLAGPDAAAGVPARLDLETRLAGDQTGLTLDALRLETGVGKLAGRVEIQAPELGKRLAPRVVLGLTAERFDARTLALIDPLSTAPGFDLSTDIDIRRLSLDGRDLGGLKLVLDRDASRVNLRHVRLTGLAGEEISVSGSIGGSDMQLTGKLDAERLGDVARLAATLLPGSLTTAIAARSATLEPAIGIASIRMTTKDGHAIWDIQSEGRLGGTQLVGRSVSTQREDDLHLLIEADLNNADGGKLFRQMTGLTVPQNGSGQLRLRGEGTPARGVKGRLEGKLGVAEIAFEGDFGLFRKHALGGKLSVSASTLGGFERMMVQPEGPQTTPPAMLDARLFLDQTRLTLGDLRLRIGAHEALGEVSFDLARAGQMAGRIKTGMISLPAFFSPVFGAGWPEAAGGWSRASFRPPVSLPVAGDLWIEAELGKFSPEITLTEPQFVWRWSAGAAVIEGFEAKFGSARFSGQAAFLRRGAQVDLAGRAGIARFPLSYLPGRISGEIPVSGNGATPAELIASLAGAGRISLDDVAFPSADIHALSRVTALPLEALEPIEENRVGQRVDQELRKAELRLPAATFPASLSGGQLRFGGTPIAGLAGENGAASLTPAFSINFVRREAEARLQISQTALPPRWRGAAPEVALTFGIRQDASGLRRVLQVSSLVNGLLAMAIQRDLERAEAFDADMREREAQLRRQRGDALMLRREREIADFEILVKREAEAVARRLEEQNRKAAEEVLRALERRSNVQPAPSVPGMPLDLSPALNSPAPGARPPG